MVMAISAAPQRRANGSEDADTQFDEGLDQWTTQYQDIGQMFPQGYLPVHAGMAGVDPRFTTERTDGSGNTYRGVQTASLPGQPADYLGNYGPLLAASLMIGGAAMGGVGAAESLPAWTSGYDLAMGGEAASTLGGASGASGASAFTNGGGWTNGYDLAGGGALSGGGGAAASSPWSTISTNAAKELQKLLENPIRTGGGIASLIASLYGRNQSQSNLESAMNRQDPFGPYRPEYASKLSSLVSDPSQLTSLPGYQAGLQAVQRSMGAQGYQGSGNMMTALADYGGKFYNDAVTQYSSLAGANVNPGNMGMTALAGGAQDNQLLNQALAKLGVIFSPGGR